MSNAIKPWVKKAHRLISIMCEQSYRQANPKPKVPSTRRKHRPYQVPQLADDLVRCLNTDNELEAKRIFLSYEGIELLSVKEQLCRTLK